MDVRQNTTLGDGDVTQQLVQLLIVTNGELEMTGNDTGLLVITSSIAGQLKNFGGEILKDSGEVNRCASTNTLSVVALTKQTVNTSNGERETGLGRTGLRVLAATGFASRLASSHFCDWEWFDRSSSI